MHTVLGFTLLLMLRVDAAMHHLLVPSYNASAIYTFQLDDETDQLTLLHNNTATAGGAWIALDESRKFAYHTAWTEPNDTLAAYKINDDFSVTHINSVDACGPPGLRHPVASASAGGRNTSVVYAADFYSPCAIAYERLDNGSIGAHLQTIAFGRLSRTHDIKFSPDRLQAYVADLGGNQIYTFDIAENGTLTIVGTTASSKVGANTRHLAPHPNGKFLYSINEEGYTSDVFLVNKGTGVPTYSFTTLPAVPNGINETDHWSNEVQISSDNRTLYLSDRSHTTGGPGYITGYALDPEGWVEKQLFQFQTPNGGGISNIIAASPWSDNSKDLVTLSSNDQTINGSFVAVYRLRDEKLLMVSKINITDDPSCCGPVLWVD